MHWAPPGPLCPLGLGLHIHFMEIAISPLFNFHTFIPFFFPQNIIPISTMPHHVFLTLCKLIFRTRLYFISKFIYIWICVLKIKFIFFFEILNSGTQTTNRVEVGFPEGCHFCAFSESGSIFYVKASVHHYHRWCTMHHR